MRQGLCVFVSVVAGSQSSGKSASAGTCTYPHSFMSVYGPSSLNHMPAITFTIIFLPLTLDIEEHFLLARHYGDHMLMLLS